MDNLFLDLNDLKYLGNGAIIGKTVRIRKPQETIIKNYSIVDDFTYISCALEIGSYCHVASHVTLSGGKGKVRIGNCVGIATGCSIHTATSDYLSATLSIPSIPKEFQFGGTVEDVVIGNHVLLGAHTIVMPGVHLPDGFACAAGTIIRKFDYEPWTFYGGYDCKRLVKRNTNELRKRSATLVQMGLKPPLCLV